MVVPRLWPWTSSTQARIVCKIGLMGLFGKPRRTDKERVILPRKRPQTTLYQEVRALWPVFYIILVLFCMAAGAWMCLNTWQAMISVYTRMMDNLCRFHYSTQNSCICYGGLRYQK